jgi:hypothetical protein
VDHVKQLTRALLAHVGELERAPYHLRLPSFWVDQVRLASERAQSPGSDALPWLFGQMYEVHSHEDGVWTYASPKLWAASPTGAAARSK